MILISSLCSGKSLTSSTIEVYSLVNEYQISGNYQITWNATDFSSGIYLVSMIAGNFTELQKIVLVK